MKLTLDDLPNGNEGQFLLTEDMEKKGVTKYDVMYLLGRRGRQRSRRILISYKKVCEGLLFEWGVQHYGNS